MPDPESAGQSGPSAFTHPYPFEDPLLSKDAIREDILQRRRDLDTEILRSKSRSIIQRVLDWNGFRDAKSVLIYLSRRGEVETDALVQEALDRGKTVGVPVIDKKNNELAVSQVSGLDIEFEVGPFGIREPAKQFLKPLALKNLDLVIAPGLAFDKQGGRIGYGKGYFDRLLARMPQTTLRAGLALEFQVYDSLPQTTADVPMHVVVTENATLNC